MSLVIYQKAPLRKLLMGGVRKFDYLRANFCQVMQPLHWISTSSFGVTSNFGVLQTKFTIFEHHMAISFWTWLFELDYLRAIFQTPNIRSFLGPILEVVLELFALAGINNRHHANFPSICPSATLATSTSLTTDNYNIGQKQRSHIRKV